MPEPDFAAELPAVAAEFTTTIVHERIHDGVRDADRRITEWRFWREPERLVSENLTERTGERWQLDGKTIFHQKLFHDDRRGISFQMSDLSMFNALPAWTQQAMIVDPELFSRLPMTNSGWRDGYPFRRYSGEIDGVALDIILRIDLMLPLLVDRRKGGIRQRTELEEAHALNDAPWQPTPGSTYPLIDFADLGDHERDPFVRRVQTQLGIDHKH